MRDLLFLCCASLLTVPVTSQGALPCDKADFDGTKSYSASFTCQQVSTSVLPSSVDECDLKNSTKELPTGGYELSMTRGDHIRDLWVKCCKSDSTPNAMCGFKVTLPCDKADFNGTLCTYNALRYLPTSVDECDMKMGDTTRGDYIKTQHRFCCKPGSTPNAMCKKKASNTKAPAKASTKQPLVSQGALPCDKADFDGTKILAGGITCQQKSGYVLPSSVDECDLKTSSGGGELHQTRGDYMNELWAHCCKSDSTPNAVCGFKITLPCDKADFNGTLCQYNTLRLLPTSVDECDSNLGYMGTKKVVTRGDYIKTVHGLCCKPGSTPNAMCDKTTSNTKVSSVATGVAVASFFSSVLAVVIAVGSL